MAQRILIAWDDERSRSDLARQLEERGYTVLALSPEAEWLGDLVRSSVDVLVVAPGPHVEAVSALLERTEEPRATVVVRSAFSQGGGGTRDVPLPGAEGGSDPQTTAPPLLEEIERALTERRLRLEIHGLRTLVADRVWNGVLAGPSPVAARLRRDVEALEGSNSPALIVGPTGSGRRQVARAIHLLSPRAGGPLHEIDCEIQSPERTSALLFGRGDGPGRHRPGWIERTHGGTLTLLGLGRLPVESQLPLAEFLRTGRVVSISSASGTSGDAGSAGSTGVSRPTSTAETPATRGLRADVRLLATQTRDPEVEVAQGWLSPALFRELRNLVVRVPALSERLEDLPVLVEALLRYLGADGVEVTSRALDWIERRPWRGNLGELELVLGRALLRRKSRPRLDAEDLESPARGV